METKNEVFEWSNHKMIKNIFHSSSQMFFIKDMTKLSCKIDVKNIWIKPNRIQWKISFTWFFYRVRASTSFQQFLFDFFLKN